MPDMRRRSFLATPALAGLAVPAGASSSDSRVIATGDGLPLFRPWVVTNVLAQGAATTAAIAAAAARSLVQASALASRAVAGRGGGRYRCRRRVRAGKRVSTRRRARASHGLPSASMWRAASMWRQHIHVHRLVRDALAAASTAPGAPPPSRLCPPPPVATSVDRRAAGGLPRRLQARWRCDGAAHELCDGVPPASAMAMAGAAATAPLVATGLAADVASKWCWTGTREGAMAALSTSSNDSTTVSTRPPLPRASLLAGRPAAPWRCRPRQCAYERRQRSSTCDRHVGMCAAVPRSTS